jgi:hypothetical protein
MKRWDVGGGRREVAIDKKCCLCMCMAQDRQGNDVSWKFTVAFGFGGFCGEMN